MVAWRSKKVNSPCGETRMIFSAASGEILAKSTKYQENVG